MRDKRISGEMRDMVLRIYWKESEEWGKLTNRSVAVYSTYELFSKNTINEVIQSYHRKAIIELRKQKINKLWNTIHTLNHQ